VDGGVSRAEVLRLVTYGRPADAGCETQVARVEGAIPPGLQNQIGSPTPAELFDPQLSSNERLAQYCVFDYMSDVRPSAFAVEPGDPVVPDPVAVIAQAPSSAYPAVAAMDEFAFRAGEPQGTFADLTDQVRVAVIDTFGDGAFAGDLTTGDDHGYTVARLIQDLLCEGEACLAEIWTYRGARFDDFAQRPGSPPGGAQTELARAIHRATADWLSGGGNQRLVINISLGWAPLPSFGGSFGGDVTQGELPPAGSVWDALRFARCNGALVVASAGNNLGVGNGNADRDAVLPAAWASQQSVPCFDADTTLDGPLVISAGALERDLPLALQREAAATVVATGSHGIARAEFGSRGSFTMLLNGTSVSAAVVSAAAAAVWAARPNATAREVWDQLADPSIDAVAAGDIALSTSNNLSRVRVCERLSAACAMGTCPVTDLACPSEPEPLRIEALNTQCVVQADTSQAYTCPGRSGTITIKGPSSSGSCSSPISLDERPLVHEQPGCDDCDNCFGVFTSSNEIDLSITMSGSALLLEWLELTPSSGGAPEYFDLKSIMASQGLVNPPNPGVPQTIQGIVTNSGYPSVGRVIWSDITTGDTAASEVPVYPPPAQ
jgi:hypothetical protein